MTAIKQKNLSNGFSNKDDNTIFNLEDNYGAHHYDRINLVVRQAKGCWLTDEKGNKYLDCVAAYKIVVPEDVKVDSDINIYVCTDKNAKPWEDDDND